MMYKNEASKAIPITPAVLKTLNNVDFPYLISFPRTGSHWLRLIMELYFEKPALTRAFYYFDAVDFTCLHHHDIDLELKPKNVIYLYRDAVETVFSQLTYHGLDLYNPENVFFWTNNYGAHLKKWLKDDDFTTKKTVISYQNLLMDLDKEFIKICDHFDLPFNREKLSSIKNVVTKEHLKNKTQHDLKVINNSHEYDLKRKEFVELNSVVINQIITDITT